MSDGAPDTLVVGVGNPLRGDDGVGPTVIAWLRAHDLPPGVSVVDGGTGGLELVLTLADCRKAIVVDAADIERVPGTWVRFVPDLTQAKIGESMRSLHDAGLAEALALGATLGVLPEEVIIFGVQPAQFSQPLALSDEVQSTVPGLCQAILKEIGERGKERLRA